MRCRWDEKSTLRCDAMRYNTIQYNTMQGNKNRRRPNEKPRQYKETKNTQRPNEKSHARQPPSHSLTPISSSLPLGLPCRALPCHPHGPKTAVTSPTTKRTRRWRDGVAGVWSLLCDEPEPECLPVLGRARISSLRQRLEGGEGVGVGDTRRISLRRRREEGPLWRGVLSSSSSQPPRGFDQDGQLILLGTSSFPSSLA